MKGKSFGFGLFLIYLALFVLDILLVWQYRTTTDLATLVRAMEMTAQLGLVIKFLILIMFGVLLTSDD